MTADQEKDLILEIRNYISNNLALSQMSDEELQEKVEEIVAQKIGNIYCPIDQRVSIVEQVYSSIRGFGLLDSIIKDDNITEVMINGPDNIFIEEKGRLIKFDQHFHKNTYEYITEHIDPQYVFRAQNDIPSYRDIMSF